MDAQKRCGGRILSVICGYAQVKFHLISFPTAYDTHFRYNISQDKATSACRIHPRDSFSRGLEGEVLAVPISPCGSQAWTWVLLIEEVLPLHRAYVADFERRLSQNGYVDYKLVVLRWFRKHLGRLGTSQIMRLCDKAMSHFQSPL